MSKWSETAFAEFLCMSFDNTIHAEYAQKLMFIHLHEVNA